MLVTDTLRELEVLVRSRYPIILLDADEDDRAAAVLRELASLLGVPFYGWTETRGIVRSGPAHPSSAPPSAASTETAAPEPVDDAEPTPLGRFEIDPAVSGSYSVATGKLPWEAFARHDAPAAPEPMPRYEREPGATPYPTTHPLQALHHVTLAEADGLYHFVGLLDRLAEPGVAAKLRDAAEAMARRTGALVVSGPAPELPEALRTLAAPFQLPPPRPAEYRAVLREVVDEMRAGRALRVEATPQDVDRLVDALRGMGLAEARRVITRAVLEDGVLSAEDVPAVLRARAEAAARDGLLEFVPADAEATQLAGLASLNDWLAKRRAVLADPERARAMGLPFPRGVLLMGVPGCGKSLCARVVAARWSLPLLRMDPAGLYDRYVGESEKNFRRALRTAERLSPVVLWIDEVEKAFPAGQGEADGGSSRRVLGLFLSWLQERRGDVFVVATANDATALPPELLRKGRFDEVFFVDLPAEAARRELLEIHLRRRHLDPAPFVTPQLLRATDGFSGAEVEQAVVAALYSALAEGSPLTPDGLAAEVARTRPLSRLRAEEVAALRAWARDRAVPAD